MIPLRPTAVTEEDNLRAAFYGLVAKLLVAPPDETRLAWLRGLAGDSSALGLAVAELASAAAVDAAEAEDEFNALFIGISRGEVVPYGSWYQAGFLHEKPLAVLRDDMARLGVAQAEGIAESEDHMASLCEMMQGLIDGAFGAAADLPTQRAFFGAHLAPWAGQFFTDLETARSARLYQPVGRMGRLFVEIETEAFRMLD